ncbi:MAG: hypothetical protein ACE5H4_14680 [Candidatus Thorarchaeota archaeon]
MTDDARATEKQIRYIGFLVNGEYSVPTDAKIVEGYLTQLGGESIADLTKEEASNLIDRLQARPTEYSFVCGRKGMVARWEVGKFITTGDLEACSHACPLEIDPNGCDEFQDYYRQEM